MTVTSHGSKSVAEQQEYIMYVKIRKLLEQGQRQWVESFSKSPH